MELGLRFFGGIILFSNNACLVAAVVVKQGFNLVILIGSWKGGKV